MADDTSLTASGTAGRIAVVDYGGSGPDVVLIHGGNRTLLDWSPVRARLDGMRLIAYDLRGHGESDVPADGDYSFAAHHADLEAVIDAVGLHRPYVVGHSIGGNVATYYGANSEDARESSASTASAVASTTMSTLTRAARRCTTRSSPFCPPSGSKPTGSPRLSRSTGA